MMSERGTDTRSIADRRRNHGPRKPFMYGFPQNVDFSFLVGSVVEQVKVFEHDYVILILTAQREIHIEGGRRLEGSLTPDEALTIDDLRQREVLAAKVLSATEMLITFAGGIRLRLFDDSAQYERVQFYPEAIIV
jgi:hypothetical protein